MTLLILLMELNKRMKQANFISSAVNITSFRIYNVPLMKNLVTGIYHQGNHESGILAMFSTDLACVISCSISLASEV